MVPVQMELGGKDACIVLPDADLDLAAAAILKGGFSFSGQRCTAVKIVVAFEVGPGRYCLPRHKVPFDSRDERSKRHDRGLQTRWMTWRAPHIGH